MRDRLRPMSMSLVMIGMGTRLTDDSYVWASPPSIWLQHIPLIMDLPKHLSFVDVFGTRILNYFFHGLHRGGDLWFGWVT